jgi:hypothetical protein
MSDNQNPQIGIEIYQQPGAPLMNTTPTREISEEDELKLLLEEYWSSKQENSTATPMQNKSIPVCPAIKRKRQEYVEKKKVDGHVRRKLEF